jgi:cytochrome bd ubiquinol oxidase subunit II
MQTFWFVLIAVLWSGYFLLEGFDFGVGMLFPFLARNDGERKAMFETVGPVWDGNEVWLVVAAGATFAAFPEWYATMFSGFYLALLLVLVLLIVRAVSFEWWDRGGSSRWQGAWTWANTIASFGAPFIWGLALANLLHGVPLDSRGDFSGSFGDLFTPYTVAAGIAVVLLFAFHGATYLTLRTTGDLRERARHVAWRLAVPAGVVGVGFLVWTVVVAVDRNDKDVFPPVLPAALAIVALALAIAFAARRRSGVAFAMTGLAAVATVATLFTSLYPRVLVSNPLFPNSLTVEDASSSDYSLKVMTVAALILTPLVLLYQGWTYYVFRARVGGEPIAAPPEVPATNGRSTI